MRKHLFSILLASSPLVASPVFASPTEQAEVVIHGTVRDQVTGKGVAGVTVYRQETDETAITDDDGNFSFPPGPGGSSHLTIVDPSYERIDRLIDGSTYVNISMK